MAANLVAAPAPTARKYASGSQTIPTGDVSTTIVLANTTEVRGAPVIDTSPANGLKAVLAGVYLITYCLGTGTGGVFRRAIVQVNGQLVEANTVSASTSVAPIIPGALTRPLAAGDVVTLVGTSSGGAAAVDVADQYRTWLCLTYLGP